MESFDSFRYNYLFEKKVYKPHSKPRLESPSLMEDVKPFLVTRETLKRQKLEKTAKPTKLGLIPLSNDPSQITNVHRLFRTRKQPATFDVRNTFSSDEEHEP